MSTLSQFLAGNVFEFDVPAQILVVGGGGGGGGGGTSGAGGGAGGMLLYGFVPMLSAYTYTVTIGGGGAGASVINTQGSNGTMSCIDNYVCYGGGGGGGANIASVTATGYGRIAANMGGSGGATSGTYNPPSPMFSSALKVSTSAPVITAFGNAGGNGSAGASGGGGGGAGVLGGGTSTGTIGGAGGSGFSTLSNFNLYRTTTEQIYGAGGGGGADGSGSASNGGSNGSSGAGGNGASITVPATSASANSGSGGGGGADSTFQSGASGGSGIVLICYPDSFQAATTTGSPAVDTTSNPGYRIYKYTASGTFLIPG